MDRIALFFDEDEEISANKRTFRAYLRGSTENIMELSDASFIKHFRLNKAAFNYVFEVLMKELPSTSKSYAVSPTHQLAACLRFSAEGSYQHGAGKDYDVCIAQSTFSKILAQVLDILEKKLCPKWITLNTSEDKKREAKMYFYEKCKIPGVVMCVDGTHIAIKTPAANSHLYYNRKGFYSINAMIICDSQLWIRCIDARFPGSNQDSFIWNSSDASTYFENMYRSGDRNTRLLADAGYPLLPWLLTPFRSVESNSQESRFNQHHSKGRNIVERTIGVLKNRFCCLMSSRTLQYDPKKAAQIINICCALHNICMNFKVFLEEPAEDENDSASLVEEINAYQCTNEAEQIRNEIMRTF